MSINMDRNLASLFSFQVNLLEKIDDQFYRSVNKLINWDDRMIALKGPRGAGKTTLMLQRLKYHAAKEVMPLYVTMDHPVFYKQSALFETVQDYYLYGGRYLFIDEIHKYENWSRELKLLYDGFPDLKVVFSASSALEIYKGEADLSRRVMSYEFPGMSFREYLTLIHQVTFPLVSFSDLLNHHVDISGRVVKEIQPLPLFSDYLQVGYLPIIASETSENYLYRLIQIINTSLYQDLQLSQKLTASAISKLKSLLGIIAESVPFEPNITSIASKSGINRETVYDFLKYLELAKILNSIRKNPKGITALQKPHKIYLENPNFNYALEENPDIGTVRETFFLNQLRNARHHVSLPDSKFDFEVDQKYVVEVGGKNKSVSDNSIIIAADGLVSGWGKTIPLWLFGMLY